MREQKMFNYHLSKVSISAYITSILRPTGFNLAVFEWMVLEYRFLPACVNGWFQNIVLLLCDEFKVSLTILIGLCLV